MDQGTTAMSLLLADIPNPLDAIGDALGGVASSAAEKAFQLFMSKFADLLGDAAKKVSDELLHYLGASTGVNLDSGWFAGPRAKDILAVVATTAGVLLVLFLLFAVIQGLLQGDATLMLRSAFLEVPISVFGLLLLFVGANALLGITDALSGAVLSTAPDSLARFFEGFTQGPQILALGFIGMIGVFLFVLTAILLFVELIVRASLIYLLMAAAPLALAVRVWPQMRGVWHAFLRLGVAMIVSKLIVALALGLGAAALGGGGPDNLGASGPNPNDLGVQAGLTVQGVLVGVTLMSLAAFAPFIVLKVIPLFEAALVAQGISRGPMRAAQTGLQGAYYAQGLKRLADGGDKGGGPPTGGDGLGARASGGGAAPKAGGLGGASGSPATGGPAPAAGGAATGGAASGGAAAGGAGAAGGTGAAGGAAAAAGPAAPAAAAVMVPVGAARALATKTADSAAGASSAATGDR